MKLRVTSRKAFTFLVLALMLHNLEEAISICNYPVHSPFSFIEPATCKQFIVAVTVISAVVLAVFSIAIRTQRNTLYLMISTGIASALVLNALLAHVFIALYTLNYSPGLLTGVTLILPSGLIVLFKNRLVCESRKQFYANIGIGLVVGYLLFALIMRLVLLYV